MTTFDPTLGARRTDLTATPFDEVQKLERQGQLLVDGRRARSHYFDGRFLAARDLVREQSYLLTRQADLMLAGGVGVIRGLDVVSSGPRTLRITAGQGTTSAGELVTLANDVVLSLDDVPGLGKIDATAGLRVVPDDAPQDARSGIYVLVLRPVEYGTRTITKYPTAVNGTRTSESGDIVEAVAITLLRYTVDGLDDNSWHQRSRLASLAFMEQSLRDIPAEALPVAMLRLDRGELRWLDPYLVRRDMAAAHDGTVGIGVTPRALREAHLLQYDRQLREIVAERQTSAGLRFAATDYFEVLPAAGRMPAATIDPTDFTQVFFPATMTVTLTVVPADELPTLLEEALLQPPIQVAGAPEDLDFTAIQVLLPVSRQQLRTMQPRSIQRPAAIPALPSIRRPSAILDRLAGLAVSKPVVLSPVDPIAAQWRQMLAAQGDGLVWFARRRALGLGLPVALPQGVVVPPVPEPPHPAGIVAPAGAGTAIPAVAAPARVRTFIPAAERLGPSTTGVADPEEG